MWQKSKHAKFFKNVSEQNYIFAGPEQWYSSEFDVYGKYVAIDDIVDKADVMMMLRVQHERHDSERGFQKKPIIRYMV